MHTELVFIKNKISCEVDIGQMIQTTPVWWQESSREYNTIILN